MLSHLLRLFPELPPGPPERKGAEFSLSSHLLANLRQSDSIPKPHHLLALRNRFLLTTGAAFQVFGYDLDRLRQFEHLLNRGRTRFVECYPFGQDRPVDLPEVLGAFPTFERTTFLSEIVTSWQRALPIRAVQGPHWQRKDLVYAQLGSSDGLASPRIPPGSYVAIDLMKDRERLEPDPDSIYFLQHGHGYLCCSCVVERGRLSLIASDGGYRGPHHFLYPQDIRIVGRISAFSASLPLTVSQPAGPTRRGNLAPLILPWEQRSFDALVRAERTRFGVTEDHVTEASEFLRSKLGASLSPRTLRRYEHETNGLPHSGVLLGLTLLNSLRFSDVLKSIGVWIDEARHYSLETLLKARTRHELSSAFPAAKLPTPTNLWQSLLTEWREWPALLSMSVPDLGHWGYRILRVNQSSQFKGLDPLVRPHSMVVLEESEKLPHTHLHRDLRDWERPIYALQHRSHIWCGYLDNDGTHISLVPHPHAGSIPRLSFLHHQVQMLGKVVGLATPL